MKNSNSYANLLLRPSLVDDIDRERAMRRLSEFVRQAWHVLEPSTAFVPGWHIDALCEHLEAVTLGQILRLLINMPPRHMKSLLVVVFWLCWEWIRHPELRWLFASYAATLAIRDSVKCRRLIESFWYQSRWGDRFALTSYQNEKSRFENDKTGYRIALGVGGAATGEGGDRVVVDDPHNIREAESETIRQGTLDWFDQVMNTRLNDPKTGAMVIVMQRLHENDLAGHILRQGGYEELKLPAEYEGSKHVTGIGWQDPRTEPGELLWPERFGAAEIEWLKRSLGSYAAAGQLQQRPAPAEGGILKRRWWRSYLLLPSEFTEMIQSWDCAFKDTDTSDYVVGQVWGRIGADKYLLDQVRGRMDCPATIQAIKRLSEKWPQAVAKLVEDKANGPAVVATLKHEIAGLIAVNPQGGKEVRAHAVSPQIEAGNVYLPDPTIAPWVGAFIDECAAFPQGAYDDQVDAMTQALVRLGTPRNNDLFALDLESLYRPSYFRMQTDAPSYFRMHSDEGGDPS
jgi:predicted phage terminase large subunit-like protein